MTLLILNQIWFKWPNTNPKAMAEQGHGRKTPYICVSLLPNRKKVKIFEGGGVGGKNPTDM